MTVVSLESGNSCSDGAVKVEFSDGSSLIIAVDYLGLDAGGQYAGMELSDREEEAFRFAAVCYRAEKIALRLIARAEQNSLALKAKLERRGIDAAAAKAVVSRLLERNLLNNGRYAELWISSRLALRNAFSPQWLLIALGKRGIDRDSSLKALKKVLDPQTEYALLLRYLEKNHLPEGKKVFSLRAELKYEGFSSAVLNRYFDN